MAAIIEWSNDAIIGTDDRDVITSWNPAAERLFGFTASEAVGRPFEMLVPPAEIEARRAIIERIAAGEAMRGIEGTRRRRDGTIAEVETTISPMRSPNGATIGFSSIVRDVTTRKANEARLRELEFRYRTFFEKMPGLTYIHLPRGGGSIQGLLHLSQHFGELTGYPPEAWAIDRDFTYKIMHPDDTDRVNEIDRRTDRTGGPFRAEFRIITKDGRVLWVRDQADLVHDEQGRPQFWIGFILDITELKQAEAETAAALAGQQAAYRELERLSNAKSDFLSMISHEFRTPLTSIQGFSELLASESLTPEEVLSFAQTINANSRRLARMIGDVLDLDRLEAGQLELRSGSADLNEIVREVLQSLRPTVAGHALVAELDDRLAPIVGDPDLILRVVTNLVANAIKYSPDGGLVTVTTAQDEVSVRVGVTDQGLGVPVEDLETIFTRYARLARPEQGHIAGTGLGLPIARQIVELHGGRIWAESSGSGGSVFRFELPKRAISIA